MTGIVDLVQGTAGNSQTSIALAYPAESPSNVGGVGDLLVILVAYGNPEEATGATPTGFTAPTDHDHWGGAGAWASEAGPRGAAVFHKTAAGGETGTVTVANGGTGTDRTMRACMYRLVRDTDTTGWVTPVVVGAADTSLGTAFSIAPGSNPGAGSGDLVLAAAVWVPSTVDTSGGVSSCITWPGAIAAGVCTGRSSGATTGGFKLRTKHYSAPVTGAATGNLSFAVTLGSAGAGVGLLVRFRTAGQLPVADAGTAQTGAEPGLPATVDATFSSGNIVSYDWEQETSPGTWTDVAGSGAIRAVVMPGTVAGTTENFRVRVTDVDSNVSAYDYTSIDVLGTAETFIDSTGTERAVLIEAVT